MADPVVPLDINEYLREKVLEVDETFELREGSAFVDFFIKPLVVVLQPIRNEIEVIRELQSLVNAADMDDEELDSLIANIFLSRRSGSNASGTVRLFFSTAQNVSVSQGTAFLSTGGLRFLADEDTLITASAMSVNVDGSTFYLDVPVTAESPGDAYNIPAGNIVSVEVQISGVVRVTNLSAFQGGLATESNTEFVNRAQTAVTVRNIVNDRSIITTLLDRFPNVKSVTPIGFNDPEMERASLTILLPGPPQHEVTIPDRGGHADVYIEGDGFVSRSTTVQSAPGIISTNDDRGTVRIIDYGFRRLAVEGGYFEGYKYPGDPLVNLLPNLKYSLSLLLNTTTQEWELDLQSGPVVDPYPALGGTVPIAYVETDGAAVISVQDIREDAFTFERPVVILDSAELLDPVSLQPTGVTLRTGESALVPASIVSDPGANSHMDVSPGSGDVHFVFTRPDGVYYQRHDSQANIVVPAVLISSETNARNLRVVATLQENLNVFFLDFPGNLRHLQIDNSGGVTVAETTISGAGVTKEFDTFRDSFGGCPVLTINDDLGQDDLYFLRVGADGSVIQAQTLVQTTAGDASAPSLNTTFLPVPDGDNSIGTTGVTNGTAVFTDANATFQTDGVAPGDRFVIYSGDTLPVGEQGVYVVLTVDSEVQVTFDTPPATYGQTPPLTASTGVFYEVMTSGGLHAVWLDDVTGNKNVRAASINSVTGAITSVFAVLTDPRVDVEHTLPRATFQRSVTHAVHWVTGGSEIYRRGISGYTTAVTSATGDTQGTGLSRSFFDASAPFLPTHVGSYVSINGGSGLTDVDYRLYQILEYVAADQVLLEEPVTDSTAADISYGILDSRDGPEPIALGFFLGEITSLDMVGDFKVPATPRNDNIHMAVVETIDNRATVYLGKCDASCNPLLRPTFVRVSGSVNNRDSINIAVDLLYQPYLSWTDFSASKSTVQFSKYEAQEVSYFVNDRGWSFSVREDASIILAAQFEGQAIRFNYRTSERVPEVESFVVDTVNRIVIGNYLTRHTFPAWTDVTITYSGASAPTEDEAVALLTDFINNIGSIVTPPSIQAVVTQSTIGDTLEKADLLDVLYDAGADSARVTSDMIVEETQPDATVRTQRDIDQITITRTARFVARNISVTKV